MSLCVLWPDQQRAAHTAANSSRSHCFTHLQPDTLYRISVRCVLGPAEGAAVSILHPTGRIPQLYYFIYSFKVLLKCDFFW